MNLILRKTFGGLETSYFLRHLFFGSLIAMVPIYTGLKNFHAMYGDYEAFFHLETGKKIKGRFPKTGEKIVKDWAK